MADEPSDKYPHDHHSWTVHVLNIHGAVFERWVEHVFEKAGSSWHVVATQFPVEYPPPRAFSRGFESTLDVWADYRVEKRWLSLLVECKKNDPRFIDWVFFRAKRKEGNAAPLNGLDIQQNKEGAHNISVVRVLDAERKDGPLAPVASDASCVANTRTLRGATLLAPQARRLVTPPIKLLWPPRRS